MKKEPASSATPASEKLSILKPNGKKIKETIPKTPSQKVYPTGFGYDFLKSSLSITAELPFANCAAIATKSHMN